MKKLLDLRFVIGLFFGIVGFLLLIYHFVFSAATEIINLWCGILFIMFGIFMLLLSKNEVKNQEEDFQERSGAKH